MKAKNPKRKSPKKSTTADKIAALEARIAALEARPFVTVQPVIQYENPEPRPWPWSIPQPPYHVGDAPPWGQIYCRTDGNGIPVIKTRVTT